MSKLGNGQDTLDIGRKEPSGRQDLLKATVGQRPLPGYRRYHKWEGYTREAYKLR